MREGFEEEEEGKRGGCLEWRRDLPVQQLKQSLEKMAPIMKVGGGRNCKLFLLLFLALVLFLLSFFIYLFIF